MVARLEAKKKYEMQAHEAETKALQDAEEVFSMLYRDAKMLQLDATRAATKTPPPKAMAGARRAVIEPELKDPHERREKRKQRAEGRAERREKIQVARRQAAEAHNVTIAQLQQNTSKAKTEAAATKKRHAEEKAADLPSVIARKSENLERLTGAVAYLKKGEGSWHVWNRCSTRRAITCGQVEVGPESVETGLSQAKSAIKTAIAARTAAAVEQLRKHDEEFQALEKQTNERTAFVKRMQEAYAASKSPADGADLSG
ncbi:hypothetical protein DIPPA_03677 [Diplonema papillatum]|nr:hypothetical protein DIPPA_34097 [Diplonema papillatum]KAJ9447167.1 hypothetical protein DIPPA_03677 [Diplonema papillatum]